MTTRLRLGIRCAAIAGIVSLAIGCSSSGTTGAPFISKSTTTKAGPTLSQRELAYLSVQRHYLPGKSNAYLLAAGHGLCREFDDGITWTGIITGLVRGGMPAGKAGAIVAVAVGALCPAHRSDLPR